MGRTDRASASKQLIVWAERRADPYSHRFFPCRKQLESVIRPLGQRFFESPTVFAYIVTMLAVGLVFDKAMLTIRDRFPSWSEFN